MKQSLTFFLVAVAGSLLADLPSVSVGALERNPVSGCVTIPYVLSAGDACVVTFDVKTNGPAGYVSLDGHHLASAWGDVNRKIGAGGGDKKIYWNPVPTGFCCQLDELKVEVGVWPLSSPPDYLVVDLGGSRKHRFYPTAESIPLGVTNPLYKTDFMVFRKIPAKDVTWRMGAGTGDAVITGRNDALHLVTLPDDFYIGIYEVTQGQDNNFINAGERGSDRGFMDSPMRPVSGVSAMDIRSSSGWPQNKTQGQYAYLGNFFKSVTGLSADLPTEAQWEFAARGGTKYPYGSSKYTTVSAANINAMAWNKNNSGGHVQVVGTKEPNDWGLYDMIGNVREWCNDWYKSDYGMSLDTTDWVNYTGPQITGSECSNCRVLRGGCYTEESVELSATARNAGGHTATSAGLGYRIVLPVAYPL